MPYLKSVSIHHSVNRSIAYILNPEKTDDLLYTASLNCVTNAKDAYLNMKMVYEHYSGKKFNEPLPEKGKGHVKAIHYIQSFDPNENITPELAHKIGKAFARRTFGDDCQIVIATHVDKEHIHNHFILNTYSISGEKFNDNMKTRNKIREYSDRSCLAFGIKSIAPNVIKSRNMAYNEWSHKKKGTSWKQFIRDEIDMLIGSVKNLDELLSELEERGYEVKRGKYISVKADGQQRFVRLKTLGDEYSEDNLIARIEDAITSKPTRDINELNEIFYDRIYQVSELVESNQIVSKKYNNDLPYSLQNDITVYKLGECLTLINREHISSIGELEGKIETTKIAYENAREELNKLRSHNKQIAMVVEHCEKYFELKSKADLTPVEKISFEMYKQTAEHVHIDDECDIKHVRNLKLSNDEKITILTEQFNQCKKLYDGYTNAANTYYEISKGDYISKLVDEFKKNQEEEKQQQITAKKKSRGR